MKKKLIFFTSILTLLATLSIEAFAADCTAVTTGASDFFKYFTACPPAYIVTIISVVLVVLLLIFRKKITSKLNNSTASQMLNGFIVFFSIFGIACFIMAVITDGVTWQHLINGTDKIDDNYTQFSHYIQSLQNAGSKRFYKSATTHSPFALLIFFLLAQFMPTNYIFSESYVAIISILRNQTFMYMYLILILICILFIYKISCSKMRTNGIKIKNEVVSFLLVVSYPTMYCISMGDITGFSFALCLFFIEFYNSEKKVLRELSIIAIAISAAIVPYTFVFAFLLLKDKSKISKLNFAQASVFFVALFILPAIFTGFGNMFTYVKSLLLISDGFVAGNSSIANLLRLTGVSNIIIYIVTAIFEIAGFVCIFILPSAWQKTAAAVCCILNLLPNVNSLTTLFVFVPLIYLLSEKTHKAIDWLYLLSFSLLVTPFPEWFYSYSTEFNLMLNEIGVVNIQNANEIIAPFATQMILILVVCQSISTVKSKKAEKHSVKS